MTLDLFLRLRQASALFIVVAASASGARPSCAGRPAAPSAYCARLSNLAFLVFVPALLFRSMAKVDLAHLPWTLLLAFFAPLLWSLLARLGRRDRVLDRGLAGRTGRVGGQRGDRQLRQHGAGRPAVRRGDVRRGRAAATSPSSACHALVLLSAQTVLAEIALARAAARAASAARPPLGAMLLFILRQSLIHPVTLPVLAGLGWNALGLPLPRLLDSQRHAGADGRCRCAWR